jgi:CRISPR-associated protein Cas5d
MRWVIDAIRVLAPIRFTHIRRNELSVKVSADKAKTVMRSGRGELGIAIEDYRQQRAAMILCDVRYGIEAHLDVLPPAGDGPSPPHSEAKHLDMFKRRAAKGQYFHHPYLGCREFPAQFRLLADDEQFPSCPEQLRGRRDFGLMLRDVEFLEDPEGPIVESNRGRRLRAIPRFFQAQMNDGVVKIPTVQKGR